ncbi:hypothetical protein VTJ83DRAFT_5471 [Remersonia thermophila]|uniref:CID domain-containing protein n=1 Tax=Remersonia thermophila TaxID=72144 RepID=A0ABR4D7U6_9PEZI
MSSTKKIAEFPDLEAKLQKPTRQSAFEKQKAEAEAKRRRDEAETAAVYEDFVKSLGHDGEDDVLREPRRAPSRPPPGPERPAFGSGAPFGGGTGKRHFGVPSGASLKSGPGSLGPPPASFGKKRPFEGFQRESEDRKDKERDSGPGTLPVSKAFEASDDEAEDPAATTSAAATATAAAAAAATTASTITDRAEEKAVSKPTLRLANLPPGSSPAFIKSLIPSNLTVENVKIVPPSGPGGTERKSIAAIVTLSKETPATDIDNAVSALQNRYLGFGYFLSLHRHLSSAAIASGLGALSAPSAATMSHPFGAKKVAGGPGRPSHHPHLGHGRAYAPPSSYGPPAGGPIHRAGILHVPVRPPRDIKQIRMIHKVIEAVLEHGPELEALLMSRPDVQRDEKWAWIWDARSEGGVWYRWKLWEIVTGGRAARGKLEYVPLFEGSHAWKRPARRLAFEYATGVDDFVSDPDYDSSDDDDFEDEPARQGDGAEQEDTFLNPIEKFKLAHLLARLPTSLSKIRKGDIARVTAFAITHASRGADEIVDMVVSNVEHPFAYTSANPDYKPEGARGKPGSNNNNNSNNNENDNNNNNSKGEASRDGSPAPPDPDRDRTTSSDARDWSAARLLGLYVISDILSSSSTSGIRHAWRYRQLFEAALRSRKTFEVLGLMAEKHTWGRLRAEKWKRSVGLVLSLWEGWCVFPVETHEEFVRSFENPPSARKETSGSESDKKAVRRWKTVDGAPGPAEGGGFLPVSTKPAVAEHEASGDDYVESILYLDVDDDDNNNNETNKELLHPDRLQYLASLDDAFDDLDLDGEPYDDEDDKASQQGSAEGDVQMQDSDQPTAPPPLPPPEEQQQQKEVKIVGGFQMSAPKTAPAKKRMRAMDMFGDSDSEGGT